MISETLFSSAKSDWETPQDLFIELDREFMFDVDVCATAKNAKCKLYFSPEIDGLKQDWSKFAAVWMNPPYGREIGKWVQKAHEESRKGIAEIVCLLPARTDTRWFHDYIYGHAEIRFLRGRLRFVGAKNSAPFPSMIVVFNGREERKINELQIKP